ncbi:MAG: hypothetical protein D6687_03255 [Acidobacteria bacterium]|jgi:hypothetical protein|nr:MAG: hypothetical protein D6687_03255 [Acidobacteriota bacterium]GIU83195.1 MAG: hypothetical protein KatS3mg006_2259 [Pyrinomonadaceae bacterium]
MKQIERTEKSQEIAIESEQAVKNEQKRAIATAQKIYLFLPLLFLTVGLLGGLRVKDGSLLFIAPELVYLIFASLLMILFFKTGLIKLEGWFSENFTALKNTANSAVIIGVFVASVQVFNSLIPESGLSFWVVSFCFFWVLWNNLFVETEAKRMLKSLLALFGLAFVVKYVLLSSMTAPESESWWQGLLQNPTKEALTWLLDLPRFSPTTGYLQFFTLTFYLIGLFFFPSTSK